MNMAEQHRLDAMHREELLRHEAAEKEKVALAREQMLIQAKKESEEKILDSEIKRQKLQTEMQLEIERRRNAAETNNLMAQTEMFERHELDYIARKDREAEMERAKLQTFYENRIAFEKKYYEEREKRMKHEAQLREQNLRLAKTEQLVPVPTSGISLPTFAKPMVPMPKTVARTATSVPRMTTSSNLANTKSIQPPLSSINMGQHMPLLTATPRLSTTLAYATASEMPEIQPQTLQPVICVADTKSATVSTTVVCMPTGTVPYYILLLVS